MTFSWSPTPLSTTWSSVLIRLVSADTDTMRKYIARNWQIAYMKISEHSYNTMFGWMFSDLLGLIMSCYPLYLESLMYNWKKSVYLPWNVHSDYSVQLQPSPPCQSEVNPLGKHSRVSLHTVFPSRSVCKMAVHARWMQQIRARSESAAMSFHTSTGQGRALSVRCSLNSTVR